MTKEQFFTFKEDLKKAIEARKLFKKSSSSRVWYNWTNPKFNSEEELKKYKDDNYAKVKSIEDTIIARQNLVWWNPRIREYESIDETRPLIYGGSNEVHMAYYIAKHRLDNEDDAKKYMLKQYKEMIYYREWDDASLRYKINRIYEHSTKKILSKYEEIVCNN